MEFLQDSVISSLSDEALKKLEPDIVKELNSIEAIYTMRAAAKIFTIHEQDVQGCEVRAASSP